MSIFVFLKTGTKNLYTGHYSSSGITNKMVDFREWLCHCPQARRILTAESVRLS